MNEQEEEREETTRDDMLQLWCCVFIMYICIYERAIT